jgi:hypothetical protein
VTGENTHDVIAVKEIDVNEITKTVSNIRNKTFKKVLNEKIKELKKTPNDSFTQICEKAYAKEVLKSILEKIGV